jgi:hypothetical protein
MPLVGNDLGAAINNARNAFNGLTSDQITAQYGNIDNMRLAMAQAEGTAIVSYFTANALIIPTSLESSEGPVTGTGTIE